MSSCQAICVFCGSSPGKKADYVEAAQSTGTSLADRGIRLVYGGGSVGLMGTVANAALTAGGQATGVIPQSLYDAEVGHEGLTELEIVDDMHARKARMATLADAFLALPGGIGTFEELFEVWTWAQLGYHDKPIGLLNAAHFYDPLLTFLSHTLEQGFIRPSCRELLLVDTDPARLVDRLAAATSGRQEWQAERI